MGAGMEEIYQITASLRHLSFGKQVAVLTDARFSGVSTGACIGHISPEALAGGPLARLRDGDVVRVCAQTGTLSALVDEAEWDRREVARLDPEEADVNAHGLGRELFAGMRRNVLSAEEGACTWL